MYITLNIDNFISIYAPDITKRLEEGEQFFDTLQKMLKTLPNNDNIFIMSDFNPRVGNHIIPGVMERFNEEVIDGNGNMLFDFCSHFELEINNTFFIRNNINIPFTIQEDKNL